MRYFAIMESFSLLCEMKRADIAYTACSPLNRMTTYAPNLHREVLSNEKSLLIVAGSFLVGSKIQQRCTMIAYAVIVEEKQTDTWIEEYTIVMANMHLIDLV